MSLPEDDRSICNQYDWNKIGVLTIVRKYTVIANESMISQYDWNEMTEIVIEN